LRFSCAYEVSWRARADALRHDQAAQRPGGRFAPEPDGPALWFPRSRSP